MSIFSVIVPIYCGIQYSDMRMRIFFQNHKGACAARNRGILEAKGKYSLNLLLGTDADRQEKE